MGREYSLLYHRYRSFPTACLSTSSSDLHLQTRTRNWDPQSHPQSHCISTLSCVLASDISNLILDILILLLPPPWLWRLLIACTPRIALSGGCVTVVEALRLATVAEHKKTEDFTFDLLDLGVRTTLEMKVGIVGDCGGLLAEYGSAAEVLFEEDSHVESRESWTKRERGR